LTPGSEVLHRGAVPTFLVSSLIWYCKGAITGIFSGAVGCDEGARSLASRGWIRCSGGSVSLRPGVLGQQVGIVPSAIVELAERPSEDDADVEMSCIVPLVDVVPLGMLAAIESGTEDDAADVVARMFSLSRPVSPGMV
jgi:hypothetical protein